MGQRILERYGMSETIINTSESLNGERVPGTVGFALPDSEVRIADDNGVELPKGEVGTIEMRGPNVFSGYWNMPDKTAEEIRTDGFFITGDLGTQDAGGACSHCWSCQRLGDHRGLATYPKEVERLLDELPVFRTPIGLLYDDFVEAVVMPVLYPICHL